jgi:hypothetical protein
MQTNSETLAAISPRKQPGRKPKYPDEVTSVIWSRHAEGWSLRQNALAAQMPLSSLYRIVRTAPKDPQ